MRRLLPIRFLSVLAAGAALTLLGCDGGLEFDNASLPAPSIAIGPAPAACSSAGAGTILFEIEDIRVSENFPGSVPANRLDVSGTVSGLGMGDSVEILLFPAGATCPLIGLATATHDGTTFTARVDYGDILFFRAVLVAHAGGLDDIECSGENDCLSTLAGTFSAVSASIEVERE